MRVRAAITAVRLSHPVANVLATIIAGLPVDRGGAALEIEADADTGAPIAALCTAEIGHLLSTGGYSRTGHTRTAIADATEQFASLLQQVPEPGQPQATMSMLK
jgi:hypothetical protein